MTRTGCIWRARRAKLASLVAEEAAVHAYFGDNPACMTHPMGPKTAGPVQVMIPAVVGGASVWAPLGLIAIRPQIGAKIGVAFDASGANCLVVLGNSGRAVTAWRAGGASRRSQFVTRC